MSLFEIVGLYIALNMLLAPVLMFLIGKVRIAKRVNLGDGGDDVLLSRIRAHGNFTENAPLALLGLAALAWLNALPVVLHIFGAAFFVGRVFHALGMYGKMGQGRFIGTILTLLTYVGQAVGIFILIVTG